MRMKTAMSSLMTLFACLTTFSQATVTPACEEVQGAAGKWIDGLQGKTYTAELRAGDGISPLPAKAINDRLFALQDGDLYIGIGFSQPPKKDATLAELQATFAHIALDRVPVPGVKAVNWETRLMTPVSSFKDGVVFESWKDGILRMRVQTTFFAAYGRRTDILTPADAGMPAGSYFQIRRPIKADLLIEGRLLAADKKLTTTPLPAEGMRMAAALAVSVGNTDFAKDIYGKLKEEKGNLFFSPYSISTALAMTSGGARGDTATQMAQALHFTVPQAELHPAFAQLQASLDAIQQKGKVKLAVANSLWPQKEYAFLPDYLKLCKDYYGTSITPMDFKGATEAARGTINKWVEDKTNNRIQELLKPGVLDPLTRLVLVNAIYFKGDWASQFKKEATRPAPFHLADGKDVEAPTMFQTAEFKYGETADAQLLEMPYAGNDLSMLIVLPRQVDGLPALEAKFCTISLAVWTQEMRQRRTQVWLPKFKTVSEFSLNETLKALGMKDAFSLAADFSGMDGTKNLYIGAVVHKAFVEVNEEGTEAAAATAVVMRTKSARIEPPPPVFRADKPFLFLIRENKTGSILFLGRIADPTK